jgi:hypothetical protein
MLNKIALSLAICCTALVAQSQNQAQVDGNIVVPAANDYMFNNPKTRYLGVSFNAFTSREPDDYDFVYDLSNKPYRFFRNGGVIFGYAHAPVYLPDGAIITQLKSWVYDNDAATFVRSKLYRHDYGSTNAAVLVATSETTAAFAATTVQELTADAITAFQVVDNSQYAYFLQFEASNSNTEELRLYAVRIEYTVDRVD